MHRDQDRAAEGRFLCLYVNTANIGISVAGDGEGDLVEDAGAILSFDSYNFV